MQNLIHPELARAHREHCLRSARRRRPTKGPRAPGRLRQGTARLLITAGERLEGEPRRSARPA
jgi:hypothetical protein